jgi:hypothetical protein
VRQQSVLVPDYDGSPLPGLLGCVLAAIVGLAVALVCAYGLMRAGLRLAEMIGGV